MLRNILLDIANAPREQGDIDERKSFIDAMFCSAKGGGKEIGKTKRGKGLKIKGIVKKNGLPIAVTSHAANHKTQDGRKLRRYSRRWLVER